ncbi:uncharacterized protein [Zea mays]|uniref:uncharacterized protein n=1 Tax=Zea mays TaxID=4577 RepID=UPI0009AA80E7|nr:uncharacterized protein LOC103629509 [Zea mays]|eukprot:XP_020395576.1 uncharacterized protein LOC103629509 [Zea mays]
MSAHILLYLNTEVDDRFDELPIVEKELKRSLCRKQAYEALAIVMPMEVVEEVLKEASILNIEEEQPFDDLSRMLKEATSWEEKARLILERSASLYEFEDHMRCSEGIRVILPSKLHMKAEVDIAKLWIDKCQAYLRPSCNKLAFGDFLKVDDIKVHKIWIVLTLDLWQLVNNIFQKHARPAP